MNRPDLKAMVDERLAKEAAERKVAKDAADAEERQHRERAKVRKERVDAISLAAQQKALEATHVTFHPLENGIRLQFKNNAAMLMLDDVGHEVVDFYGCARINRDKQDDRVWWYYFTPTGVFVSMRFTAHPVNAPNWGPGEKHPTSPQQFVNWTVDLARVSGSVVPERTQMQIDDVVHDVVAHLIKLAD